ncbi:MAG: hypothetical protein AAF478_03480 [Pseudomonadota bacterium]
MSNRKRQTVSYRKLQLGRLLPEGLLGVQRSRGEAEREIAGVFAGLANQVGRMADTAAQGEGQRAGRIAGADEDFRPTRGNSIRDRAFDAAGERSYMQRIESNLRTDMQKIYQENRDNPQRLAAANEALKQQYLKEHVYSEIQGDFVAGFSRLDEAYRNQALNAFETKQRDHGNAAMLARLNELETTTAQALASLDPNTESGSDLIGETIYAYENELDQAVRDNRMGAAEAEQRKQIVRQEQTVKYYVGQASAFHSDQDLQEYTDKLREDFSSGNLSNVDAEAFAKIQVGLKAVAKSRKTDQNSKLKIFNKSLNELANRIANGGQAQDGELNTILGAAANMPDADASSKLAMSKISVAGVLRDSTLSQSKKIVNGLRDAARNGDPIAQEVHKFADKTLAGLERLVKDDPLAAAASRGVIEDPGYMTLNVQSTAEDYQTFLSDRLVASETAAEHWDVPLQIFKPGEARSIADFAKSNPEHGIDIAGGLVAAAGSHLDQLIRELKTDAPVISQAGKIIASGGSRTAALDVFRGHAKDPDGKRRPGLPGNVRGQESAAVVGNAFGADFVERELIEHAAGAMARARAADQGVDPKGSEAKEIFRQSLQEAAGRTVVDGQEYGGIIEVDRAGLFTGNNQIIVPSNMRSDLFIDVVNSIVDEDLSKFPNPPVDTQGNSYRASDLHRARPIPAPGGYAFAAGDPETGNPQWIRGANGQPFILDIENLQDLLGSRVPGAWR